MRNESGGVLKSREMRPREAEEANVEIQTYSDMLKVFGFRSREDVWDIYKSIIKQSL